MVRALRAALLAAVLTAASAVAPVAASPADSGEGPSAARCRDEPGVAHRAHGRAPSDHLDAAGIAAADRQLRRAEAAVGARGLKADIAPVIRVYAHVLRSSSGGGVPRGRVERQVRVMNQAYKGAQSPAAAEAPFRFRLVSLDVTTNRNWYRMNEGSRAERLAKRTLHRGGATDLNLYIGANSNGVLGWATQPSRYDDEPVMDGVVIARHTLPGGTPGHYSAGDAAVHESGHWLGLFHTFAGRCGRKGDLVRDTPAEARPSYTCPRRRDTCAAPGKDPVHNFMDYSYDSCMNQFTPGQVRRMTRSWSALRAASVVHGRVG